MRGRGPGTRSNTGGLDGSSGYRKNCNLTVKWPKAGASDDGQMQTQWRGMDRRQKREKGLRASGRNLSAKRVQQSQSS